jgi:antitoxin HicB
LKISSEGAMETVKKMSMSKKNIGSSFGEFLTENITLDEATAIPVKRAITWQIEQEMKAQSLNKTEMVKSLHTSRAALNRLLNENDTSLTLTTLASAAAVLSKTLKVELAVACETNSKLSPLALHTF